MIHPVIVTVGVIVDVIKNKEGVIPSLFSFSTNKPTKPNLCNNNLNLI
jgi:hypothetical protein